MEYIVLIIGFILLIKGADVFVDGSAGVARKYNIPSLFIGLTIVAMGTSMPEAAVSISASVKGSNAIAVSNVIGSNIFNLLVVVGVSALIKPVRVSRAVLKRDMPISIIGAILLLILIIDGSVGRIDAIILLVFMAAYMTLLIKTTHAEQEEATEKEMSMLRCIVYIILGIAAIILGGNSVVDSAKTIARNFGMSETLIGLTIVAIGTSLPELATSVVAAVKGQSDLSIGNVVGSNIFNIFFILGLSGVVSAMSVEVLSVYDLFMLIGVSLAVYAYTAVRKNVYRIFATLMILAYVGYSYYIFIR